MGEIDTIEVDRLTTEILILKQQTAQNIIEIGKRLIQVKESLLHGEWGIYLKEKVEFSQESARRFMRVAEEFSNSTTLWNLPPSKVFALLDMPPEEREQFVAEHDTANMSVRELQQAIKERDKALQDLENTNKVLDEKAAEANRFRAEKQQAVVDADAANRLLRQAQDNLKTVQDALAKEQQRQADLKRQLEVAQATGNSEDTDRIQEQLAEANKDLETSAQRIDELEAQLKAKPIETVATKIEERIPEDVERELAELRKQGPAVMKFRIHFDTLTASFKTILEDLAEMPDTEQVRYRGAVNRLISKMAEML